MATKREDDEWGRFASSPCPCGGERHYAECCKPLHDGSGIANTAEQLMRSRYTAYAYRQVGYLVDTHHPDTRSKRLRDELLKTIQQADWLYLRILSSSRGKQSD